MDETDLLIIGAPEADPAAWMAPVATALLDEDDDRLWRQRHDALLGDMP
jgi:hypothetical protein